MLIRRAVVRILSTENIYACGNYLKVTEMLNFGFIQILKNPAFAPKYFFFPAVTNMFVSCLKAKPVL